MNIIYSWQKETWRILARESASMGHALLLKGREGIGKFAFGRQLAKFMLCKNPPTGGEACGSCPSCGWFEQGSHPDFRLIAPEAMARKQGGADAGTDMDAGIETGAEMESFSDSTGESAKAGKKPSKQIIVEQIRSVADFVSMSSHQNGYKIVLIYPAETMNPAAANALLKNLEEPPPQTVFILVTHHAQHLLPTVRSRCRQIAMPVPDLATATAWLEERGIKEPAKCLAAASYAPLAALGFNDDDYLERHEAFIRQISAPGSFNPIALAEEMQKSDLPTLVNWLQKWCYDLMSFCTTGKIRYHPDRLAVIKSLASGTDPRSLATYLRTLNTTQRLAHHPLNPKLFLEEMLYSYAAAVTLPAPGPEAL
jgi:DNA polymerase III subunit delta'